MATREKLYSAEAAIFKVAVEDAKKQRVSRGQRPISRADLAEALGYSEAMIRKLRSGERHISRDSARILARLAGIKTEELDDWLQKITGERAENYDTPLWDEQEEEDRTGSPSGPLGDQIRLLAEKQIRDEEKTRQERQRLIRGTKPGTADAIFKNRVEKVAQLERLLRDRSVKLISILGRGGIGKSELLGKLCTRIEDGNLRLTSAATIIGVDGIIYIGCSEREQPTLEKIFEEVEWLLGIDSLETEDLKRAWLDQTLTTKQKIRRLLEKVRDGSYLLVLDSLEYALSRDGSLADPEVQLFIDECLATDSALRLLSTSRKQVRVSGEVHWKARTVRLDEGLPAGEAVALLREFDPEGELGLRDAPDALLEEAARRCDYVPLALRRISGILYGDRERKLTLSKLLEDTELFTGQVTENLIEYQYRHVSEEQQRVLQALSVYRRPVPLVAVQYLLQRFDRGIDARSNLLEAVDNLFVTHARGSDLYELHDLDQEHAYKQIPEDIGEFNKLACHRWAAQFYLDLANEKRKASPVGEIGQVIRWPMAIKTQWSESMGYAVEHLLLARAWEVIAERHGELRAFNNLRATWGFVQEVYYRCARLLEAERKAGNTAGVADWLHEWAVANYRVREYKIAEAACLEGEALAVDIGDDVLRGHFLHRLGVIMQMQGEYTEADKYYAQSVKVKLSTGGEAAAAPTRSQGAEMLEIEGKLDEALEVQRICYRIASEADDIIGKLAFRRRLGRILRNLGRYTEARSICEDALADVRDLGDQVWLNRLLIETGQVAMAQGDSEKAEALLEESRDLAERVGSDRELADTCLALGFLYHDLDRRKEAREVFEIALRYDYVAINFIAEIMIGLLDLQDGEIETGRAHLNRGIESCQKLLERTPRHYEARYCLALANLAFGHKDRALEAYSDAIQLCTAKGVLEKALHDLHLLELLPNRNDSLDEAKDKLTSALST